MAVKFSLADRAFFRRAHRTNAAIFMDQRLFCDESTEPCFFRTWIDAVFSLNVLRVIFYRFDVPFFREEHCKSRSFSSSFNIFFRRRTYQAALFSTSMERRFPFRVVFSRLDQRPFLAESVSSHRLFRKMRLFLIDHRTFPSGVISL